MGLKASLEKIRDSRFSVMVFQSWRERQKIARFRRKVLKVVSL